MVIVYRTYDAEGQIIGDPAAIHNCIKSIDEYSGYENWVASGKYYTMLYGGEYPASLLQTMNCDGNTVSTSYRIEFGAPFDLIAVADEDYNSDEKLRIKVYVPGFSTSVISGENEIWAASLDWYMKNVYTGTSELEYETGYYAPSDGVMRIPMIYYPKDNTTGANYGWGYEYFLYNGYDNPFVDTLIPPADSSSGFTIESPEIVNHPVILPVAPAGKSARVDSKSKGFTLPALTLQPLR